MSGHGGMTQGLGVFAIAKWLHATWTRPRRRLERLERIELLAREYMHRRRLWESGVNCVFEYREMDLARRALEAALNEEVW